MGVQKVRRGKGNAKKGGGKRGEGRKGVGTGKYPAK
jgi:hypothetical protein